MKCSFFIFLALSFNAWSGRDDRELLKCLGVEEKVFHAKKITGPTYDLNQRLIAEMVQIPKTELSTEAYQKVCSKSKISPSWRLLEQSIRMGKGLFIIPNEVTGMEKEMTVGMIDDYLEATKEILLGFISQIQAQSPSPTCLKEEIPQLDAFFTDIKYLQEDVDIKQIFAGRDLKIFEKLKDYPHAFERCRERIKKKAKSASKAKAKKS